MSSDEIIEMFGEPEDVRSTMCGKPKSGVAHFGSMENMVLVEQVLLFIKEKENFIWTLMTLIGSFNKQNVLMLFGKI